MARARLLILGVCAIGSGQLASAAQHRCNTDHIRAEFNTSEGVPDLTGCKPDSVRPILSDYDYGLVVQNKVPSETIGSGRIVSQRVSDGEVYVDVSSGSDQPHHGAEKAVAVGVIGGILGAILTAPKKRPPPAAPTTTFEPTPPPVATSQPLPVTPAPQTVVQPTPTPPPQPAAPAQVTQPAKSTVVKVAQADKPPQPPVMNKPPTEQPPAPPEDTPATLPATGTSEVIPPEPIPPPPPEVVTPTPVFRLTIEPSRIKEGDQLALVIRREGNDRIDHVLGLAYGGDALLDAPQPTYTYLAGSSDDVTLSLHTVAMKDGGDHNLIVTLASTDGTQIAQPPSVTAVILDQTWWEKLLQALAAIPIWVRALAAVAATAAVGAGTYFSLIPRATCSIEGAGVSLGGRPFKNRWPAVDVDVVIGDPTFFISTPLSIRSRADAEPSPA